MLTDPTFSILTWYDNGELPRGIPVRVTWIDSESTMCWQPISDFDDPVEQLCVTVGLLVNVSKTLLILALSYDETNDAVNGVISIPLVAVRTLQKLGGKRK